MSTLTASTSTASDSDAPPAPAPLPAFTADYGDLAAACKALAVVAGGKRHVHPINARVHVRVHSGMEVELTAFDWDTVVRVRVPATDCTPGVALVEHETVDKSLVAAVKGMRKPDLAALTVSMHPDTTGEALALDVAGYGLPTVLGETYPLEEFPEPPALAEETHRVDRSAFALAAADVAHAADSGLVLPILGSVYLKLEQAQLTMWATDRYRLAEAIVLAEGSTSASAVVPIGVLRKILPHLNGEQLRLGVAEAAGCTWATLSADRVSVTCRCVEGEYPKVSSILERNPSSTVIVQRDLLHAAAARCAALCKNLLEQPCARLSVDGEAITLAPHHESLRAPVTAPEVPVELDGDLKPMQIGFNATFFLEALATLSGDRVCIGLETHKQPAILLDPDRPGYRVVLMPLRLVGAQA